MPPGAFALAVDLHSTLNSGRKTAETDLLGVVTDVSDHLEEEFRHP
jgi:hypothetical protein